MLASEIHPLATTVTGADHASNYVAVQNPLNAAMSKILGGDPAFLVDGQPAKSGQNVTGTSFTPEKGEVLGHIDDNHQYETPGAFTGGSMQDIHSSTMGAWHTDANGVLSPGSNFPGNSTDPTDPNPPQPGPTEPDPQPQPGPTPDPSPNPSDPGPAPQPSATADAPDTDGPSQVFQNIHDNGWNAHGFGSTSTADVGSWALHGPGGPDPAPLEFHDFGALNSVADVSHVSAIF
jgi:hypothetical protein